MSAFEQHCASGMALSRTQQEKLWTTLKECGATDEWLGFYWNKLVVEIATIKPPVVHTQEKEVVRYVEGPRIAPGVSTFDPVSFATGMMLGGLG